MLNNRRSEIQIIGEIINLSKRGAKKTEILYQTNMSYSQLQHYLTYLLEKNILKQDTKTNANGTSKKIFVTTEKGTNLLGDINKLFKYFK